MIQSTNVDPCDLNILINCDKPKELQDNQSFYCHIKCIQDRMHPNVKGLLIVHLVDPE